MTPRQQKESPEYQAGVRAADKLSPSEVASLMDSLVWGEGFDWRDWFVDPPSKLFRRGFLARVTARDQEL